VEDEQIARTLDHLRSGEAERAWAEFLDSYSPLILQIVRLFEHDIDLIEDCFLYVCEQLCRNRFRRLSRFHPDGRASFQTWLRAVVRHLCLDWRRREYGRKQPFESISRLPTFYRDVFRCIYAQGLSLDETVSVLRRHYPDITGAQVLDGHERLLGELNPRQLWLLRVRANEQGRRDFPPAESDDALLEQIADVRPDPESLASVSEQGANLARALARLESSERLLIKLRYEQGLTLGQIAKMVGLPDAQTADRRIRTILERLRKEICARRGKPASTSV